MFDGHAGIDAAKYLEQHLYRIFDGLLQKHTGGLGNALRLPHLEESGLFTPLGLQRLMNDLFEKVLRARRANHSAALSCCIIW